MKRKISKRFGSAVMALAVIAGGSVAVLPQVCGSTVEVSALSHDTMVKVYKNKLKSLKADPSQHVDSIGNIGGCEFAIADVNADGVDDLLVNFTTNSVAGMHMQIWSMSGDKLISLGRTGSFCDFYKNGYIKENASHNQGPSLSVWPYRVIKYDYAKPENKDYGNIVFGGYSIDKEADTYTKLYDASQDKDKDGVIYYISNSETSTPMTKSEYETYVNKYIPEKNKLNITWKIMTDSNISNIDSMFSLYLNKTSLSLGVGETYQLSTDRNVKWRTSAPKILTVDQKGKVKTVGTGTAWVTIRTDSGKEKSCKITVKKAPTKVSLSKGDFSMGVGETFTLSAVLPNETAAAKRTFRTSNSSVIKMTKTDWTGSFKAVKAGTAWVTVRLYNGVEKSCKITVKPAPTNVYVNKKTINLKVGQTAKLSAYLNSGAACATRTYRSSAPSIVKMTKTNWEGEFKALKRGTAWVTVRTYNGKEASCKVTVS